MAQAAFSPDARYQRFVNADGGIAKVDRNVGSGFASPSAEPAGSVREEVHHLPPNILLLTHLLPSTTTCTSYLPTYYHLLLAPYSPVGSSYSLTTIYLPTTTGAGAPFRTSSYAPQVFGVCGLFVVRGVGGGGVRGGTRNRRSRWRPPRHALHRMVPVCSRSQSIVCRLFMAVHSSLYYGGSS